MSYDITHQHLKGQVMILPVMHKELNKLIKHWLPDREVLSNEN